MVGPADSAIEITGVRTSPKGAVTLVEIESTGETCRLMFGQTSVDAQGGAHGFAIDKRPVVLVRTHAPSTLLALGAFAGVALPVVGPVAQFTEAAIQSALSRHVSLFRHGLYSVEQRQLPPAIRLGPDAVVHEGGVVVVDPGPLAPDDGTALVADLSGGVYVLLGGRRALISGDDALVVSASFIVEADGFVHRRHDRSAREDFARTPSVLFEDIWVRDAIFAHHERYPDAFVGPFALDVVEPALQLATGLSADLVAADGVTDVRGPERVTEGGVVVYRIGVECLSRRFVVGVRTDDGRRLTEAHVRSSGAFRATGLRPSARAISRCLRELAREEDV